MTLFEITKDLVDAINNMEVDEDGCIVNFEELDKLSLDFDNKAINVALYIKNLNADAEALKAEKMAFAKRQKAAESNAEGLKKYLDNMLKMAGKTELKDTKVALTYRKSKSCELDLSRISPEWLKPVDTTREDNYRKADITKALKEGQEIEGAILVEKMNLQIK